MDKPPDTDIKDPWLVEAGFSRIVWALWEMPVLCTLMQRFSAEQPLRDIRISGCLHNSTETANLARTLQAGCAKVVCYASNPLRAQDDVAAALVANFDIGGFA